MGIQMEIMSLSMDTLLKMTKEGFVWELYQMCIGIFQNSYSELSLANITRKKYDFMKKVTIVM